MSRKTSGACVARAIERKHPGQELVGSIVDEMDVAEIPAGVTDRKAWELSV